MICKKCGNSFPSSIRIEGKIKYLNKRSYCLECSPLGSNNRKNLSKNNPEKEEKVCPKCNKMLPYSSYTKSKNKLYSYCRSCMNVNAKNKHKEVKEKCIVYKGGKCCKCGYNKCPLALEFHHKDPSSKDFNINNRKSFNQKVKDELDKCILVCANCHREIHYEIFNKQK